MGFVRRRLSRDGFRRYLEGKLCAKKTNVKLHKEVYLPQQKRDGIGLRPSKDERHGSKIPYGCVDNYHSGSGCV